MKNTSVKKTGFIRKGAVVPSLILILIIFIFARFFLDGILKRSFEYVGSHIHGAEIDIAKVKTSFLNASLEIDGLEVTDKEHPERDLVEVGKMRFALLWDGLLRAKIVIDDASIVDISALKPRKHPGFVLPPEPPSNKPSLIKQTESAVLDQTQKKYSGNFLGDIAGVLGSGDAKTQLKNLEGTLKSDAKIKELQSELGVKKKEWDERLKKLPQQKELQSYVDRVKALKFDLKDPATFAKNVGEAQKIVQEAQSKVKIIDETQRDLKNDIGKYSGEFKDVEKLVQEDLKDLQTRLKIPNVDAKEFSEQLFMHMLEQKLGSYAKYVEIARHYMPAKSKAPKEQAKDDQVLPPKRGKGKTYHYPITTSYPLFWLKHAEISSEVKQDGYSGNVKGVITDVTSSPSELGRPTKITLNGEFPGQGIHGLDALITIDHTTDTPKESLVAHVAEFPVKEQTLSSSPDVSLALKSAKGKSEVKADFVNEQLTLETANVFTAIQYDLEAKNDTVKQILDDVLKGIPEVTVNANASGSLHNLSLHINSNLGEQLAKGLGKQLQARIESAKAELKKQIDQRIGGDKNDLKNQIDQFSGGLSKDVGQEKGAADNMLKNIQSQASGGKNNPQKSLEEKGKELLKGLHF